MKFVVKVTPLKGYYELYTLDAKDAIEAAKKAREVCGFEDGRRGFEKLKDIRFIKKLLCLEI